MKTSPTRVTILLITLCAALVFALAAPRAMEQAGTAEYKFIRLVDDGSMPCISEALNREADRGWSLREMSVLHGEPDTIYLVFEKERIF